MRAAVDHVHHRDRQRAGLVAAEIPEERDAGLGSGRFCRRERHAEDRVRAESALVRRTVEIDQQPVEARLVGGVETDDGPGDLASYVGNRPGDGLAPVLGAPVAQLDGLVDAGRGSRRHCGATQRSRLEADVDLDRRVSTRVEDLACGDVRDCAHCSCSLARSKYRSCSASGSRAQSSPACPASRAASSTLATNRPRRSAQLELRVDVEATRDVHAGEEHVAELLRRRSSDPPGARA